jgi:predicted DNA-binding transcriptional regulator AlpA
VDDVSRAAPHRASVVTPRRPATAEPLWGPEDVSAFLGVPVQTLYQWRRRSYGPPGHRLGKHLRWDPDAVRAWFAELDA